MYICLYLSNAEYLFISDSKALFNCVQKQNILVGVPSGGIQGINRKTHFQLKSNS